MGSTFSGIEMGKRSLFAHTQSITTAGHNISNANAEGYSRQRVQMSAMSPLYRPDLTRAHQPGQIGQGVISTSIDRIRDEFLDDRITAQQHQENYWKTRSDYYTMLEQIYNEPADVSVRTNMDKFWESWQELSLYPESQAARQAVVVRGESLANSISERWNSLRGIGNILNSDIVATVEQVNGYAKQIAELNNEIVRSKAMGDNPNDLLDRRDLLVDKLSQIVNITTDRRDADEFMVHVDGMVLVQGDIARSFEMTPTIDNNGYSTVVWSDTKNTAQITGGKLGALIELRDVDVRSEIQSLNTMALNFSDLVNDVHRNASGANRVTGLDFFVQHPFVENTSGNFDRNGDGAFDSTYVFRMTGTNTLVNEAQIGIQGNMTISSASGNVSVPYYPTDTVEAVINRINDSNGEVKAYLDRNNVLVLKATSALDSGNPDFVIRHVEDSGFFLTGYAGILSGSGEAGAYDYAQPDAVNALTAGAQFAVAPITNPAGYIEVNPAIRNDVMSVGAAFAGVNGEVAAGDGRAAVEIAAIRNTPVMIGRQRLLDDYFADTVTNVGLKGQQAELNFESQHVTMQDLRDRRDSISGVNIDEELADLLKFQHGYNAAARFITVWDNLVDVVINRLGV